MARSLSWHDDPLEDVFEFRAPPPVDEQPDDEPVPEAPDDWREWLATMFAAYVSRGFADYHVEFWTWLWEIRAGVRPAPFVGIWPREGGKSTSVELGVAALGLRGCRGYVWYVRATQENADDAVGNIGALLESSAVDHFYPAHAQRKVTKYGSAKAWRRNRLHTAGGFIVDAVGLDTARRGVKIEEKRPDLIIFDDIDDVNDSADATKKKKRILTKSLIPAGQSDRLAVIAVQNLIIPHGIFAQLADNRADFLVDRVVSGPHPAIVGLKTASAYDEQLGRVRHRIVAGTATWEGQNLETCQHAIDSEGLTAFIEERQHQVHERQGALWTKALINEHRTQTPPKLKRIVVGVDPPGGSTECGIIVGGLGYDGKAYLLADRSTPAGAGPAIWGHAAVTAYDDHEGDLIAAEKNFGGDMVESNLRVAGGDRRIPVKLVTASRGKALRAEPCATLYTDGLVKHVGTFPELEQEMTSWVPGDPNSPNRLDGWVWVLTELMLQDRKQVRVFSPGLEKKTA